MIVGIDFGTCYSSIAIMKGFNPIVTYVKETTQVGIPSRFMFSKESNRELYGIETKIGEAYKNPKDVIKNMKTLVREDPDNLYKKIPGHDYILSDVIEKFLTYLVSIAKKGAASSGEFDNSNIDDITVTVPAGLAKGEVLASEYNKLIRDAMMRITGLSESHVRVLQEPVAASISYLYGENLRSHYDSKQTILVCDLGGGTFDVTVMEYDPNSMSYSVIDTDGDIHLGGNDWDSLLGSAILEKLDIEDFDDESERIKFQEAVTKLKVELTDLDESMIFFKNNGSNVHAEFTRDEFEEISRDLRDRLLSVVERVINRFEPGLDAIDKIVLVGGGSNMPQVRDAIVDLFDNFNEDDVIQHDPSNAIAKGAAIYAMLKSNPGGVSSANIVESVAHTYGFESRYSKTKEYRLYNLIFKGESFSDRDRITRESNSHFVAISDDQRVVCYTVYESDIVPDFESGEYNWADLNDDAVMNGMELEVTIPPEYYGRATSYSMRVEMALDTNGILEMTVRDKAGNKVGFVTNYKKMD